MGQLALPLTTGQQASQDDLLVSECNRHAFETLDRHGGWPFGTAILVGAAGCGKTAMGQWFVGQAGGMFADDAQAMDDRELFHLWNTARQVGKPLLIAASVPPSGWQMALPDLKSRIASALLVQIGPPDDQMLAGLLEKALAREQMALPPNLVSYALMRMDRSWTAPERLVAELNRLSLERKQPLGQKIVREALDGLAAACDNVIGTQDRSDRP